MRRIGHLYRAWKKASRFERLLLAWISWDYTEGLMRFADGGLWRSRRGRRPNMPGRQAPFALIDIILGYGWTLSSVADRVGVSSRSVQRWWSGDARPRHRHMVALDDLSAELLKSHGAPVWYGGVPYSPDSVAWLARPRQKPRAVVSKSVRGHLDVALEDDIWRGVLLGRR